MSGKQGFINGIHHRAKHANADWESIAIHMASGASKRFIEKEFEIDYGTAFRRCHALWRKTLDANMDSIKTMLGEHDPYSEVTCLKS